jgi:replicative DNA helicase
VMDPQVPCNLEAEQAVLGSILLDRDAILAVAPFLGAGDFYLEQHRWVYEAALGCYARRVPPDLQTVAEALRAADRLALPGGIAGLVELTHAVPTAYHVEYYARIVVHLALCRRIIQAGGTIAALGYESDRAGDALVGEALSVLTAASALAGGSAVVSLADAAAAAYDALASETSPGLATRLRGLDARLGGLHAGDLVLLAARPSVGKSSLALQIAYNVAVGGGRVLFVSLEMSEDQLCHRLQSMLSGVDLLKFRRRGFTDEEILAVTEAMPRLAALPFDIDPSPTANVGELRRRVLQHAGTRGRPALVVVDYLQLMHGRAAAREANRVQEVAEISRGLKGLARELGSPVLALSQLSRAVEGRQHKVPQLADLRDSGALEQDADIVLFIHRPDGEPGTPAVMEIHVAKNRQGPQGIVPLYFQPALGRWNDVDARSVAGWRTAAA